MLGCGTSKNPNSTVTATAALTGYPSAPSAGMAIDEHGKTSTSGLNSAGRFSLLLPKGHRYHLAVALSDREVPVVFARGSGRFGGAFSIASGGAKVDLGALRYLPSMLQGSMQVATGSSTMVTIGTSAQSGECVDGKVAGATTLCVDDDRNVSCDDGSASGEAETETCDEPSQTACSDSEAADSPASDHEASVAEHNPPDRVDGCEEEDDDQDGEHED
jgi:hypothetical protein